jgi:hypothetical protein
VSEPRGGESKLRAAFALALVSAACASAHERVWGRLLGRSVGNTTVGLGLTLTLFMLGSGAGSLLASRLVERGRASPRAYAAAEFGIALGALATLAHCLRDHPPSASIGVHGTLALVLDVAASSVVTLVPAVAMGLTYPLLVAVTPRSRARATALYAAGLRGAVLGAIALAPRVGLDAIALAAAAGNVVVAVLSIAFFVGDPRSRRPTLRRSASPRPSRASQRRAPSASARR